MFKPTIEDCNSVSNSLDKKADAALLFRLGYLTAVHDFKGQRIFEALRDIIFCDDEEKIKEIKIIIEKRLNQGE